MVYRRILPHGLRLSEPGSGTLSPPELSPELQTALQQAVRQSLGALDSLRLTLRRHVHSERNRGVSLRDIDAHLRKLMSEADARASGAGVSSELTAQVAKWTRSFFSGPT